MNPLSDHLIRAYHEDRLRAARERRPLSRLGSRRSTAATTARTAFRLARPAAREAV